VGKYGRDALSGSNESVKAWLSFVLSLGTGAKKQKGTGTEGGAGGVDGGLLGRGRKNRPGVGNNRGV